MVYTYSDPLNPRFDRSISLVINGTQKGCYEMTSTNKTRILPRVLTLRITGRCNFRCPFCFGPKHELSNIDVDALLTVASQFKLYGVEAVTITGGEPLLVDRLPELLEKLKEF